MRARYDSAAGTRGGAVPLPAEIFVPEYLRFDRFELIELLAKLRYPLATHVYFLILAHGGFQTGEFLGGYARLMELCRPPAPPIGRPLPGPTYKQLRTAIDLLEAAHLIRRNALANQHQGQLRLRATPRKPKKSSI
jgi:hypothetical protein